MTLPAHAPYTVEVGHEVEVRVREDDGTLIAECDLDGDTFGASVELTGNHLEDIAATDELVEGVARLVWHELLGEPVFREGDEEWVERVDATRAWEIEPRRPTLGYIANAPEPEPPPETASEPARPGLAESFGDADVSQLQMSQEEMAALTRGEVLPTLLARVLATRSTENLIETALAAVVSVVEDSTAYPQLERAASELGEVLRRFGV